MDRKINISSRMKFLIFFIVISLLRLFISLMSKRLFLVGFPLVFLKVYNSMQLIQSRISFNVLYFLLDLLILYIIFKLVRIMIQKIKSV
ncbi:hypothetical protein SAMN05443270_0444 [Lacrimispora sphenoides]|jgi:hypothetical protein|nr:hypothetical protein SAMN05443270_0444 [Lacrimispora sphenoides]